MVIIVTDPIEKQRWLEHQSKHIRSKKYPGRDQKVIELSKMGYSINQIRVEIGSNTGYVTGILTRARRQGLI